MPGDDRAGACRDREEQARRDEGARREPDALLDPLRPRDQVLEQQARRRHEAPDEPASWCVVAAEEQVKRHHDDERQQQAGKHRRNHEVAHRGITDAPRIEQVGREIGGNRALLVRQAHRLAGRTESSQQRVHGERDDGQDHAFAERVEAAEVDEDHVHDVPSASVGQRALEKEGGRPLGKVSRRDRVRERGHSPADRDRDAEVARPPARRIRPGTPAVPAWQPPEAEEHEQGRHDLDRELRQREVRRGVPAERDDDRDAGDAGEHERAEPVAARTPGLADGGRGAEDPEERERGREREGGTRAGVYAVAQPPCRERERDRDDEDEQELPVSPASSRRTQAQRPARLDAASPFQNARPASAEVASAWPSRAADGRRFRTR
jgi:hypothetical protein